MKIRAFRSLYVALRKPSHLNFLDQGSICSVVKQLKSMHLVKEFLIESAGFSLKYSKAKLPKRMSVLLD